MLLNIEGLDGAGKDSAINNVIIPRLEAAGLPVDKVSGTGGTPMSMAIREINISHWNNEPVSGDTELLLMYASRIQTFTARLLPFLKENPNGIIIMNRSWWSSYAYQVVGHGASRALFEQHVEHLERLIPTTRNLVRTVSPEGGLQRDEKRAAVDRLESEGPAFWEKTRRAYDEMITRHQDTTTVIDANGTFDDVNKQLEPWVDNIIKLARARNF